MSKYRVTFCCEDYVSEAIIQACDLLDLTGKIFDNAVWHADWDNSINVIAEEIE